MKRYALVVLTALLALIPGHAGVRADAPLYTVENLNSFGGLVPTITGINASGEVVGNVSTNGSQAVRYTVGPNWEAVPGLATSYSVATGVNASGDIVGYHLTRLGQFRAFRYRVGIGVEDIEPLAGGSMTLGYAINDAGDVVGFSDSSAGFVPFRASIGLPAAPLPTLGGDFAYACAINASGQAAGVSTTPAGAGHGMRIDNGAASAIDIQSFDGPAGNVNACAIDAAGRVGGQSDRAGQRHAFRFSDTGMIDLDTFGSPASNVESIAAGVSVGWYTAAGGALRAFAHRDADGSFDLNTRIDVPNWVLTQAKAVNENGVIAGEGTLNGAPAVYRLTPNAGDTIAPVINSVTPTPSSIYPPKGQMVPVSVAVNATDDSGQPPVCTVASITGGPSTDVVVNGDLTGSVRAVGGRTYTLNVQCADAAGNTASSSAAVTVLADSTPPSIASVSATPSNLWPPDNRLVPVTVAVAATDDVDDAPVCSLTSIGGFTGGTDDAVITGPFSATLRAVGGRTYSLNVRCADSAGNASAAAGFVVVPPDTTAPEITSLTAMPDSIWPANNKWVAVSIVASATDDVVESPACGVTGVTGAPASDVVITGPLSAKVLASKNANGTTRTYVFAVTCSDEAGNASDATVSVSVAKDQPSKVYLFGHHRGHHWAWAWAFGRKHR
jgi:probable HAF family extracellular repeat protein